LLHQLNSQEVVVELRQHIEFIEEAECDEMWSFVGSKAQQRWLWYAIDHATGKILAYVLGPRKDEAFIKLKAFLKPFGITRFYTDDWGAYERHLEPENHSVTDRCIICLTFSRPVQTRYTMGMAIVTPYLKTGKRRTDGTFLELRTKPHLIYACFNEAGLAI
jgi:hypothetical protein